MDTRGAGRARGRGRRTNLDGPPPPVLPAGSGIPIQTQVSAMNEC